MKTVLQIPRVLRQYAQGHASVELSGETVSELLQELERWHPKLYRCICDETDTVRRHINIFLNNDRISHDALSAGLREGDVVSVYQAVSGG